jgi:hypothetical protein
MHAYRLRIAVAELFYIIITENVVTDAFCKRDVIIKLIKALNFRLKFSKLTVPFARNRIYSYHVRTIHPIYVEYSIL